MRAPSFVRLRAAAVVVFVLWLALGLEEPTAWRIAPLVALALGLLLARWGAAIERALAAIRWRAFVALAATAAFASSLWLARGPMMNRPLAIDASVYLLQARALSHGALGIPAAPPLLHASGRFLFEGPDGRLFGVFPPGWPLALAPFVRLGAPMLAGPALAALLILAQAKLATALGGREIARRAALLFALLSFTRAMETADLLSHALVATLATLAMSLALGSLTRGRAIAIGACLGLALAARLLDGVALTLGIGALLAWRRSPRAIALAALGGAPLALFLIWEQRAATGGFHLTQSLYFERSDWPPSCHRLGFGADVGCEVEHALWMPDMGGDGYGLGDAARVLRERGVQLGKDLLGSSPLALLVALLPIARPRRRDLAGAGFVVAFSLAYGLFYFGNVPHYGSRHLFPIAPLAWILAARAAAHLTRRPGTTIAVVGACAVGQLLIWRESSAAVALYQRDRPDLERAAARAGVSAAIVRANDAASVLAATDPIAAPDLIFTQDDRSGLLELRRARPDLPVYITVKGDDLARLMLGPPAPGLLVELERAWPTFQRQRGLLARPMSEDALDLPAKSVSGRAVLAIEHASAGASLEIPFWLAEARSAALHLDGVADPGYASFDVALDGAIVGRFDGVAPRREPRKLTLEARALSPGRHTLELTCTDAGRDGRASFDALVGDQPAPPASMPPELH